MGKRLIWTALAVLGAIAVATPALAQKTVTIVREIDTDRYDPHKSTSRSGAEVMYMIGDTLVNLDYDMKTLKPGLAKSWSVSPDGLTYTFMLRDDVTFCSGKKMTAKDVVFSLNAARNPKNVFSFVDSAIASVSAPDDSSARMSSIVRTPPPTVSGMKHASAVRRTTSRMMPRFS